MTVVTGAALICFRITEPSAYTAGQELAAFKDHAWTDAVKRQHYRVPGSPSGYVVSMTPPIISPSNRARIDVLEQRYETLVHRSALADWLFTRGVAVALAIAGFCWFLTKTPGQRPAPAPDLAPGHG